MMSSSGGSTAKARAGNPSVARLTYKTCMAVNGIGAPMSQ